MNEKPKILVVDDVLITRRLMKAGLAHCFDVADAESGEQALELLPQLAPVAIVLDVEMQPGMDGFETCRRIRADERFAHIPVVFVSAREAVEDRLSGYEAGGEDYIVKPFSALELEAKLCRLIDASVERRRLSGQVRDASSAAMTAMISMSEMGALLEVIKQLGSAGSMSELADALVGGLRLYGLQGCVQLRAATGVLNRSSDGETSPLELSVLEHLVGMGRMVQFKNRMVINYPDVSLLLRDMPVEDEDRCGRLRDHLTMLVEAANVHVGSLAVLAAAQQRDGQVMAVAVRMIQTLGEVDRAQRDNQVAGRVALEDIRQRIDEACVSMLLTNSQEVLLHRALDEGIESLLSSQSDTTQLQDRLSQMVQELRQVTGVHGA
ncbi:PleD family two-component system response regulator [Aquitalea sp. LB_tupeE]|uniref:response regulator n=1 Tax=Aquitalea sp. LB_tupeE TaxID=2748078 RepID=UPI0015B8EA40|nr:response regulator [Aquitalea sp. LB_tupeE]NWK79964.1 response regulator [Aquitalea sp. LB_tupeE]